MWNRKNHHFWNQLDVSRNPNKRWQVPASVGTLELSQKSSEIRGPRVLMIMPTTLSPVAYVSGRWKEGWSRLWVDEEDQLDWMAQLKCEFNWGRAAVLLVTALVTLEFISPSSMVHTPNHPHPSISLYWSGDRTCAHRPDACKIQVTTHHLRLQFWMDRVVSDSTHFPPRC